jgi:hydroxymethylpyrimidine/phosphomethylpyrimidine kinase
MTATLSIAGFDPSAGAGVLADVKTFESNGVYGLGVVSALTWQNDVEIEKVEWLPAEKIISQVDILLRRFDVSHIKIGIIENIETLMEVIAWLKTRIERPVIVYDPVLKASAGFTFHSNIRQQIAEILQSVYCITPNIPEAEQLFGADNLLAKLEEASELTNIYLKGGHAEADNFSTDMLFTNDHTYAFSNDWLKDGAKHGSGCVLSSALTAQLALGKDLATAAEIANAYTYQFLASSNTLIGHHKPLPHEAHQ